MSATPAPAPASVSGQTLTWNLGDLAAGASTTITITVNVDATSGAATNVVTAATDSVEGRIAIFADPDDVAALTGVGIRLLEPLGVKAEPWPTP